MYLCEWPQPKPWSKGIKSEIAFILKRQANMSQIIEPKKVPWGVRTLSFHRVNPPLSELHVFFLICFLFYFNKPSDIKQQILFMILWIRNSGRVQLGGFFPPCGNSWVFSSGCNQIAAEPGVAESNTALSLYFKLIIQFSGYLLGWPKKKWCMGMKFPF